MKCLNILIVHNYYQFAGGEDTVVAQDAQLLEKHGHHVYFYKRNNEELKHYTKWRKLLLPFTTFFSFHAYHDICRLIREYDIDIVHVHNTLPLISYSVYYAAKKEKVRLVQTIHNFRLVCPNALFYRDGHICEDCLQKGLQTSIRYGCYRNSKAQTAVVAAALKLHRMLGTFHKPDAYIALTQFNKEKIAAVADIDKIYVKPNYLEVVLPEQRQAAEKTYSYYVYAARLETVKGIFVLLDAFAQLPDEKVLLLGTGPEEQQVRQYVAQHNLTNVIIKGFVPHEEALSIIDNARAVIYPSLWYEGFPMTIVESFACGTPVIASDTPNLTERIADGKNGYTFHTGSPERLSASVRMLSALTAGEYGKMREQSKMCYKESFTEETVYERLLEIYSNPAIKR